LANALVRDAALQAAAASKRGILERVFARMLEEGLVYAQIWEDPEVDLAALELGPTSRVVAIASGGCNAMSYLVADPACVQAVDLNPAHVALLKLKLAAARHRPEVEATLRALAGVGVRVETAEIGRRYALLHRLGRRGLGCDPRAAGD
jgi:S-adenosylmethionine-diacylglycerol 3-amino-3-carboxypropyl transferase